VINEDRVAPDSGFETHSHANMEIISYILEGEIAHKDSMGNKAVIKAGEFQIMSAGTGVTHSEYNKLSDQDLHFLQIWVIPNVKDEAPSYQQKAFDDTEMKDGFRLVVSPDGENGSLTIKQDALLLIAKFDENVVIEHSLMLNRKYWVQMVKGNAQINGESASSGDGFAIENEGLLSIKSESRTEILLFDLAE
jgi:quercetin 2,3-dioxygenase